MESGLIEQQLGELQSCAQIEGVRQVSDNSYLVAYSPQLTHSPYSSVLFSLRLTFPDHYPEQPPFLAFQDKIYHLNIDPVSGRVSMPIIREDWSPFLTVTDVFNSLTSILDEPEVDCAATETLRQEYVDEPEKYLLKVGQMANLYVSEPRELDNHSVVEHVEEIAEFKEQPQDLSFEEKQKRDNLKDSLPYSQIPKAAKESFESPMEKADNIKIEDDHQEVEVKVSGEKQPPSPKQAILPASRKPSNKKLAMTESFFCERKEDFQEMQASLKKSDQLIEVLLLGCESMEQTLQGSKNGRVRQLLEKRLESQWAMVEELLEMTSRLKEKLFTTLKNETNQLLR